MAPPSAEVGRGVAPAAEPGPYRGPDRRRAPEPARGFRALRPAALLLVLAVAWIVVGLAADQAVVGDQAGAVAQRLEVAAGALAIVAGATCLLRWHLEGAAPAWWFGWSLLSLGIPGIAISAPDAGGAAAEATELSALLAGLAFLVLGLRCAAVDSTIRLTRTLLLVVGALALSFAAAAALVELEREGASALVAASGCIVVGVLGVWGLRASRADATWLVPMLAGLGGAALVIVVLPDGSSWAALGAGVLRFAALAVAALGAIAALTVTAAGHRVRALHSRIEQAAADERRRSVEEDFAHRMHEVRSSVVALAGGVRTLEPADANKAVLAHALEAELERLRGLVAPDVSGDPAPLVPFSIADTLEPTLEVCKAAGWPVSWQLDRSLVARGRPAEVAQIVHGLVANAARHAPGSPIEVTAGLDGNLVLVHVKDRGPGVARSDRERVFEPGVRGPSAPDESCGLGLAIARRLARDQGGELWVEGAGGATFVLSLGRAETVATDTHRPDGRLRLA